MNTAIKPVYEWETTNWHQSQKYVFKLQKRIYRAAKRGDVKTVRSLQRLLTKSWYAKLLAVKQVTPHYQGKSTSGIERNHHQVNLAQELQFNDKSQPIKRVEILKPGKDEQRLLGIPSIKERAKQALLKLALEPEWEARFEPNSYGFRPGRSCDDAIAAIYQGIVHKPKYVLAGNIAKFCDRINHQKLFAQLQTSPNFRRQIKAWLKSGIMDGQELFPTAAGTIPGEVIPIFSHTATYQLRQSVASLNKIEILSPLLANIALHGMEEMLAERLSRKRENGKQQKVTFVRYADNFVLMDESLEVVLAAKQLIEKWLPEIGLTLQASKTRISHTFQEYEGKTGFDFLGFNVRQYAGSTQRLGSDGETARKQGHKTFIKPSKEAIEKHLRNIDNLLAINGVSSQEKVINLLNSVITQWADYYSTVASSDIYRTVDNIVFQKLLSWAKSRRNRGQNNRELVSKYWGVNRGLGWNFITSDHKYILAKHQGSKMKRHVKVKGNKSPYDGDLAYWSKRINLNLRLSNVAAVITSSMEQEVL